MSLRRVARQQAVPLTEACEALGVSEAVVLRMAQVGRLKLVRAGGRVSVIADALWREVREAHEQSTEAGDD